SPASTARLISRASWKARLPKARARRTRFSRTTRTASPPKRWSRLSTEAVNPASRFFDRLDARGIVDVMVRDHAGAIRAVRGARVPLSRASTLLADAWRRGGRWILVGAGTSGRLAVLEAAELPPTFGTPARRVLATMAGGPTAVRRAREGVEDDTRAGALAMRRLRLTRDDVVIGISASGVTPFVIAAMRAARAAGAR